MVYEQEIQYEQRIALAQLVRCANGRGGNAIWREVIGGRLENRLLGWGTIVRVEREYNTFYLHVRFDSEPSSQAKKFNANDLETYFIQLVLLRPILEPITQLANKALKIQIKAHISAPDLNTQDIRLALKWYQGQDQFRILQTFNDSGCDKRILIEQYDQDQELMRVLSARAAEKGVMEFYQRYGRHVEDVSIHQVTSDENSDWESYDLKIDGIPVDVKNSRRSWLSPNTYVKHCVPRFKQNRKKQDVTIAGVLSQYLWVSGILDPENISGGRDTSVIFLGVTTDQRLDQIQNEFKDDLLHIHWERHNRRGHFLPAWVFDYPEFVYQQRDDAIRQLAQQTIPERRLWEEFNVVPPIPLLIAAGMNLSEFQKLETFTDWEGSFLSDILDRRNKYGLSLPFLFLGILKHFLQMVSHSSDDNYRPDRYRRLIFSPEQDPDHEMPLGIYDPLKTIDSLITALETLWEAEHGPIRSYRVFQLQGPNILRGQEKDQVHWKTLIAYCGGEKCDKNPLVLGECDHCRECGKLICPECDFCSNSERCSLSQTRRPTPSNPSGDRRSHEQRGMSVPDSSHREDDLDDIPF